MNDHHEIILDTHFWPFVDDGDAPETTPLFTGIYRDEPLAKVVSLQFQLSESEAETVIELARKEVGL